MSVNLYELGYMKKDKKISPEDIRDQSFFTIYDAKQSEQYSFGGNTHEQIMESYAIRRERDFQMKFRMTPSEYIEKAQLNQILFESQKDFLREMDQANESYKKVARRVGSSLKELENLKASALENEKKIEGIYRDIKAWEKVTQQYLDTIATVGDTFAESEGLNSANLSGQTPKGLATDPGAAAAYDKAYLLLEQLAKRTEAIGADASKLKKLNLVVPKTTNQGFVRNKKTNRKVNTKVPLADSLSKMQGFLSLTKGIAFEVAIANALYDTSSDIVKEVLMLGSAEGVTVKDNKGGAIAKMSTSKTDNAYVDQQGFQVNLSLKNQKKDNLKPVTTKFLSTSILRYVALVGTTELSQKLLIGLLGGGETRKKGTEINLFLASLVADMAIGSGAEDKVDFIVFNNGIISLGEYYRLVTNNIFIESKLSELENLNSILGRNGKVNDVRGGFYVKASH